MYPVCRVDSQGKPLSGTDRYTQRFAPGKDPPVNAFWSLTMYDLPQRLLVANPINRDRISSPMLPQMNNDADGALTLYIQNQIARQGQGIELAASAEGAVCYVHTPVLAERSRAGWFVDQTGVD